MNVNSCSVLLERLWRTYETTAVSPRNVIELTVTSTVRFVPGAPCAKAGVDVDSRIAVISKRI